LAARSSFRPGKSVLYGKKTTALTKQMELIAWRLTRLYLGDYYRTYPTTVEDEVRSALARPEDQCAAIRRRGLAWDSRYATESTYLHGGRETQSLCRRIRRDDRLTAFAPGVGGMLIGFISDGSKRVRSPLNVIGAVISKVCQPSLSLARRKGVELCQ
jgi:hypothetical protein